MGSVIKFPVRGGLCPIVGMTECQGPKCVFFLNESESETFRGLTKVHPGEKGEVNEPEDCMVFLAMYAAFNSCLQHHALFESVFDIHPSSGRFLPLWTGPLAKQLSLLSDRLKKIEKLIEKQAPLNENGGQDG